MAVFIKTGGRYFVAADYSENDGSGVAVLVERRDDGVAVVHDMWDVHAARLIALDKYPGRKWEDLTEGEQEQARQSVMELRRILGEKTQDEPSEGH